MYVRTHDVPDAEEISRSGETLRAVGFEGRIEDGLQHEGHVEEDEEVVVPALGGDLFEVFWAGDFVLGEGGLRVPE